VFKLDGFVLFLYMFFLCPFLLVVAPIVSFMAAMFVMFFYNERYLECQVIVLLFLVNLCLKLIGSLCFAYIASREDKKVKMVRYWWWTYPFYFSLHVIASIMAIYKLCMEPHKWDKTEHGLSRYNKQPKAEKYCL
jgi:hypothetical protein